MSTAEPKHYANVAIVRLLLTLMIFVFHVLYVYLPYDTEQYFPLSAALQGFNFLAAYLCSRKTVTSWRGFYRRRMTKLIVPAVLAMFFILASTFVYVCATGLSLDNFNNAFVDYAPSGQFLLSFGVMWYAPVMVAFFAMTPLFFYAKKHPWVWWIFLLVGIGEFVASAYFWQPIVFTPFALGFYYGFLTGEADFVTVRNRGLWDKWIWPLLALWVLVILNFVFRVYMVPTGRFSAGLHTIGTRLIQTLIGVFFVITLLRILRFHGLQTRKMVILDWTDKLSYPFFLIQFFFMVGVFDMRRYIENTVLSAFVSFFLSVALAFSIYLGSKPFVEMASRPSVNKGEANPDEQVSGH
jgi:peptidoglycan/LPS O-acetylase OafA/YrhL